MDLWLWHWQISWVQCLELRQAEQGSSEYLLFRLRLEEDHLVEAVVCLAFQELLDFSEAFRWHRHPRLRQKVELEDEVEEQFPGHCLLRLLRCLLFRPSSHREVEEVGALWHFLEEVQDQRSLRCQVHSL